jgi:beta-glucosidase
MFHRGALDFTKEEVQRIRTITDTTPTVIDVYLDRPAVVAPLLGDTTSLVVNFGASGEAFVKAVFGELTIRGRLPFDIPSSTDAVAASRSDVPFDTLDPTFRFGHGETIPSSPDRR